VRRATVDTDAAAELFLSEKTSESQLSKVFAKLGVSGDVAVAEAAGRERPPED
jgi:DNA-binding NarL/FixJ family response regulator